MIAVWRYSGGHYGTVTGQAPVSTAPTAKTVGAC